MVGSELYLKMSVGDGIYLLPSDIALSIENRDRMRTVEPGLMDTSCLVGRYNVGTMNWPAYQFESDALVENDWTHAVADDPSGEEASDLVVFPPNSADWKISRAGQQKERDRAKSGARASAGLWTGSVVFESAEEFRSPCTR